jgi:hypothetical protein
LPPLIPVEPTYTVRAKRPSTRESAAGDDRLESWKKRLQQQQKNKKPPADQQQQMW